MFADIKFLNAVINKAVYLCPSKKDSNAAFCYTPSHKVIILGTELLENFVSMPTKISSAIPLNSRG